MLKRRSSLLLVPVAVVALAATGCGGTSDALRVGDQSVSNRVFEDSLDAVYEDAGLRTFLFQQDVPADQLRPDDAPPGAYPQQYVNLMANNAFQFLLAEQIVADNDLPSDDARDTVAQQVNGAIGDADAVPDSVRDFFVDGITAVSVLRNELTPDELNEQALAIADEGVDVNARFGRWDGDTYEVTAPEGPRPAPGGDEDGGLVDGTGLSAG